MRFLALPRQFIYSAKAMQERSAVPGVPGNFSLGTSVDPAPPSLPLSLPSVLANAVWPYGRSNNDETGCPPK